jgi:hypothetical protein
MSQQLQITGGAKVRDLQDVIIGTSGVLSSLAFNVANGVPKLDVNGKILVSQLPNSVMEYQGTWNANTNTPTLVNGVGNQGDVYLCNVAGTTNFGAGPITFFVGDQVIYSGTIWQRASGATGTVTSVAVTETGDSLNITGSPITTSGTINIGFAGTNLQYINGAGDLTTFPSLTGYIPYTGATSSIDLNNQSVVNISHLGINTTTVPTILIRAVGDNNSSSRIAMRGYSSNANSSSIRVTKFRGTVGAPQAPQSGDSLGKFELAGYGTTSSEGYPQASFEGIATENWGATARGSKTVFKITPNTTTTQAIALTINQDKSAVFESDVTGAIGTFTNGVLNGNGTNPANLYLKKGSSPFFTNAANYGLIAAVSSSFILISDVDGTNYKYASFNLGSLTNNTNRAYTLPDASGTLALLESTQTFTGANTFSLASKQDSGILLKNGFITYSNDYTSLAGNDGSLFIGGSISGTPYENTLVFTPSTSNNYTFPNASGTIAFTSDLTGYVTLATTQTISGAKTFSASVVNDDGLKIKFGSASNLTASYLTVSAYGTTGPNTTVLRLGTTASTISELIFSQSSSFAYTYPSASGTLALTSNLSSYLPLAGGTMTGPLILSNVSSGGYGIQINNSLGAGFVALREADDSYTLGMTSPTTTTVTIHANNSPSYINTTGNFGFGNASPAHRVDVTGTGRFTGVLTLGSTISNGTYTYTLPSATGTLALTSNLSSYLPLSGGTLTGGLNGVSAIFSNVITSQANGSTFGTASAGGRAITILASSGDGAILFKNASNGDGTLSITGTSNTMNYYFSTYSVGGAFVISNNGNCAVSGALSKGSGSFRIEHPLESLSQTHQLVHSFIEGPQADLIYRGKLTLVDGKAQANIDEISTMTEGTFEVLCREVQCFTTNESGWDLVKGKVIGNIIYIESQNTNSTDEISWMVIGERKDNHIMDTDWTDDNGKVIVEPLKIIEPISNKEIITE